jgi:hypothetical protein
VGAKGQIPSHIPGEGAVANARTLAIPTAIVLDMPVSGRAEACGNMVQPDLSTI